MRRKRASRRRVRSRPQVEEFYLNLERVEDANATRGDVVEVLYACRAPRGRRGPRRTPRSGSRTRRSLGRRRGNAAVWGLRRVLARRTGGTAGLERLEADLEAIRTRWRRPAAAASAPPPAPHTHRSNASDARHKALSAARRAAFLRLYAKDAALHDRACARRAGPPVADYFLVGGEAV